MEDEIEVGVDNETTIVQLCTAIRILLIIGSILYFRSLSKWSKVGLDEDQQLNLIKFVTIQQSATFSIQRPKFNHFIK